MIKEESRVSFSCRSVSSHSYLAIIYLSRAKAGHLEIQRRDGFGVTALPEQGMEGEYQSLEPGI